MGRPLAALTASALRSLASAARSGRLSRPYSAVAVGRLIGPAPASADELEGLGLDPPALAIALDLLAAERDGVTEEADRIELVWTGPETTGSRSRDTLIVVRELFSRAETSVLVAGFAVYQGKHVFAPLASRMAERPSLRVRFFLNIQRPQGSAAAESEIVKDFVDTFRHRHWPGARVPEIYYDPRALVAAERAVLHAKCIVVDDREAFVTSANFTEAAQERNIEAGVLVRDAALARSLSEQFDSLAATGVLKRALAVTGP